MIVVVGCTVFSERGIFAVAVAVIFIIVIVVMVIVVATAVEGGASHYVGDEGAVVIQ